MYHCTNRMLLRVFSIKKKKVQYSYDPCPNLVYFNTPLFIMYLGVIEKLICYREIEFHRVYFLRFCTKYDTKYRVEDTMKTNRPLLSCNLPQTLSHVLYLENGGLFGFIFGRIIDRCVNIPVPKSGENTFPFLRKKLFCRSFIQHCKLNQSVENSGVTFVKGTNDRNEFFEK